MKSWQGITAFALLACPFISPEAPAQAPTQASIEAAGRSFYLGRPVLHPEELSGVWEMPDGHGGALGLHLVLSTAAPATAMTLVGAKQIWLNLVVGIYERKGAVLQGGEENWFSDSVRGGSVKLEGNSLTLHSPPFDLELTRTEAQTWSGRLHRKNFDAHVTLTRPQPSSATVKPWFVGTWRSGDKGNPNCLHIAQQAAGQFIAWSDSLSAVGAQRFARGLAKPSCSFEIYGDLGSFLVGNNKAVSFEFGTYRAGCCSHTFVATRAANGLSMIEASFAAKWTKMPFDTCMASVPRKNP